MFKNNKWEDWWDNLDPRTKAWLEKQPIYTVKDYNKAIIVSLVIGFLFGLLF